MPLASSREASMKREAAAAEEAKVKRRLSGGISGTRPTTARNTRNNTRRQTLTSLPRTFPSTTVVNIEKVNRRRMSLRRQSSSNSLASMASAASAASTTASAGAAGSRKENGNQHQQVVVSSPTNNKQEKKGPTPYYKVAQEHGKDRLSPPHTRSAKKKKKRDSITTSSAAAGNGNAGLLVFSPPDQEKNRLREKAKLQAEEMAHQQRVKHARENEGRLLVFSPSNNPVPQLLPSASNAAAAASKDNNIDEEMKEPPPPPLPADNNNKEGTAHHPKPIDPPADAASSSLLVPMSIGGGSNSDHHSSGSSLTTAENNNNNTCNKFLEDGINDIKASVQTCLQTMQQQYQQQLQQQQQSTKSTSTTTKTTEEQQQLAYQKQQEEMMARITEQFNSNNMAMKLKSELKVLQLEKQQALEKLNQTEQQMESQKNTLTDEISGLKQHITELTNQLDAKHAEYAEYRQQQEAAIRTKTQQLEVSDTKCRDLETAKVRLEQQINELEQSHLALIENMESNHNRNLSEASQQLEQVETQMKLLQVQYADLESVNTDLKEENASIQAQLRDLQAEQQEQQANNNIAAATAASDAAQNQIREQDLEDLADELEKVEQLYSDKSAAYTDLEYEYNQLVQDKTTAIESCKTIQRQLDNVQQHLLQSQTELQEEKQQHLQAMEQLQLQIEQQKQQIEQSENKYNQLQIDSQGSASELASQLETQKVHHETTLHELSTAMAKLQQQYSEHQNKYKKLQQDSTMAYQQVVSDASSKERTIGELMRQLEEKSTALQQMENNYSQSQQQIAGFGQREQEWYRKLQASDNARRQMHNKCLQLAGNIRVFVRVRPVLRHELQLQLEQQQQQLVEAEAEDNNTNKNKKKRKRPPTTNNTGEKLYSFPGIYDDPNDSSSSSTSNKKQATDTTTNTSTSNNADTDMTKTQIVLTEPFKDRGGLSNRQKRHKFGFDNVFDPTSTQTEVWDACEPLIQSCVDGYNVTLFAYGQTGSGKTHTMLGDEENPGLVSRAIEKLFQSKAEVEELSRGGATVKLSVEMLEVYNETVNDMLANGKEVDIKIRGKVAVGNVIKPTQSVDEVFQILDVAQKRRCVKATASNEHSSRSHLLFTMNFHVSLPNGSTRKGKLNICDLAGSERLSSSGANYVGGVLLKETQCINSSLSTLSNVIEKLQQQAGGNKNVTPSYRESKLTSILANSLGGNSKTLAIVCCSPLEEHYHESLCSLRFAEKVNKVELKAATNITY